MPYVSEPADPRMINDDMSDSGSSTSSGMLSDARSHRAGSIDTTPSAALVVLFALGTLALPYFPRRLSTTKNLLMRSHCSSGTAAVVMSI